MQHFDPIRSVVAPARVGLAHLGEKTRAYGNRRWDKQGSGEARRERTPDRAQRRRHPDHGDALRGAFLTAGGLAALVGGLSADLFTASQLSLTVHWRDAGGQFALDALEFSHWDFFFFFAAAVGLYAVHRLSLVRERGEVEEQEVVRELLASARQGLRGLSTVAGVRAATEFPVAMLLRAVGRNRSDADRA